MSTENQHRNEVHLRGILARDPEIRYTPSGKAVATFTVATTCGKYTEYHRCVAWENQAEKLKEQFKKDSYIEVTGRLQTRSWDDKSTGQKKYMTEVVAWGIGDGTKEAEKEQQPATPNIHGVPITDDDIPF
jgi:single-strand DNA-binding protein